jgi:hypothetical protein
MGRHRQPSEDSGNHVEITWTSLAAFSEIATTRKAPPRKNSTQEAPVEDAPIEIAGTKKTPTKESHPKTASSGSASNKESTYNDAWEVDGEPIRDIRDYLDRTLLRSVQHRYIRIVSIVLSAINGRQNALAGFSLDIDGEVWRPERTLITTIYHPQQDRSVLLVVRITTNRAMMVHVLDSVAWLTTRDERLQIHSRAHEHLISTT